MLLTLFLATIATVNISDCMPARWAPTEPASLSLLEASPINCLVVEEAALTPAFLEAARQRKLRVLASLPADDTVAAAQRALKSGVDALYAESIAESDVLVAVRELATAAGKPLVWLPERVRMPLQEEPASPGLAITGTHQGLWAGVKLGHEGEAEAAPSGPPWIDTNSGFLRFVRTITPPEQSIWIANRPPPGQHVVAARYLQSIADAAMAGARWVLSFDDSFWQQLLAGEDAARDNWQQINHLLRFYQEHHRLTQLPDYSKLAIVQDAGSGALVSGSVLDMVESKHIPAIVFPPCFLG